LEWVATLAPVRIGLIAESLEYDLDEQAAWPELKVRKQKVEMRLKYVTHVAAIDEKDVEDMNERGVVPAMWWPQAVPARFICEKATTVPKNHAVFPGALYGERKEWLEHPRLRGFLVHLRPPEDGTIYSTLFDALHVPFRGPFKGRLPGKKVLVSAYLYCLRRIRRQCFARWLKALQTSGAVVNLPHFVKAYPGRVVEAMAAGRPVISWEIPDRPRNKALFEDGVEILLYPKDNPEQLGFHIERLLSAPDLGERIAANARCKLRRFHTMEKRVRQILDWVETGEAPIYG
jgi:glycosyltransferase involved in cell wall biosynthesis